MVLLAWILHIYFCVGVVFSSSLGVAKVINLSCFKLFHTSTPFLYDVNAYSCSFSIAFKYRSGPFLAKDYATPLSSSSTSWLAHYAASLFLLFFFLLNFRVNFLLSPSLFFTPVASIGSTMVEGNSLIYIILQSENMWL